MPSGTALRMANTLILPYLDSLLIVKVILKGYLEHCRLYLGIILRTFRIIGLSNNVSPVVPFNPHRQQLQQT